MKLTYHNLIIAAALVLGACQTDDIVNPGDGNGNDGADTGNGLLTADGSVAFVISPDGMYDFKPMAARTAIVTHQDNRREWFDEKAEFFMSATTIPAADYENLPATDNHGAIIPNSRGVRVNSADTFRDIYKDLGFTVVGYHYDGTWDETTRSSASTWIPRSTYKHTDNNVWSSDYKSYWSHKRNHRIYAVTNTPYYDGQSVPGSYNQTVSMTTDNNNVEVYVQTPNFGGYQNDVMVAVKDVQQANLPGNSDAATGAAAQNLEFRHILAGLRIRLATRPGVGTGSDDRRQLNRLDINGLPVRDGIYNVDKDEWRVADSNTAFSLYTSHEGNWDATDANSLENTDKTQNFNRHNFAAHAFDDFLREQQTFMLIPQNLKGVTINFFYTIDGTTQLVAAETITLPDIQLKAGTVTYIDIQEPSVFVEGFNSPRENGQSDPEKLSESSWPLPDSDRWVFRLYEGADGKNYYETTSPVYWDEYKIPSTEESENDRWKQNYAKYYGHRRQFNILTRRHKTGNDNNIFFSAADLRYDYFIAGSEVTYRFHPRGDNQQREYIMKCWGSNPPAWTSSQIRATGSGWQCLGGKLHIRVTPDRDGNGNYGWWNGGEIRFRPESTANHPIRYPYRLPLCGTVDDQSQLNIEPINDSWNGYEGNRQDHANLRSFRQHWMYQKDPTGRPGFYEATVYICPWNPFNSTNTARYVPSGWSGYGTIILYMSTMHGSYGHSLYPWDEFESRMGVSGQAGIDWTADQKSGTLTNFSRVFTSSYIKLKEGTYYITYDMNKREFTWNRTGDKSKSTYGFPQAGVAFMY